MLQKIKNFLWPYKWYIVHGAAVVVLFLDPSVKAWLLAHQIDTAGAMLVWGWLLHWAQGQAMRADVPKT
jgi:hypothetical protein